MNRAARLRSIAHGGQLIISGDVQRSIEAALPEGVWLTDLGLHGLKDLAHPERVWQVGHRDMPADFPPLRSLDAVGHNLPVQLTAFVGRDEDVLNVRKRIETSPLLTLTGPGGIGKTRLALQAAADASDGFPDGVWLVELAAVADSNGVVPAIAEALGVREEPARPLLRSIVDHVAVRRLLLVLDNCEHQIDEVARVVHDLLSGARNARVLATSREPLGVYGEAIYAVQTLDVPDARVSHPEEALASAAVRLFADRAALVNHEFSVGEETEHVVEICRRLEGIPLAIELAAAHIRTASASDVAARLVDRLEALATGPRTAPERHRTLRAAIESSFDVLADAEKAVFVRLAVFTGGFTAAAAIAVCEGDPSIGDVERHVGRLADRSLVQTRSTKVGTRYVMLETIRDYALSRIDPAILEDANARLTQWVLEFVTAESGKLWSPQAAEGLARLDEDHDNVRAALARSIDADPETAAGIILAVHVYWFTAGHLTEGRHWTRRGREATSDPRRRTRFALYEGQFSSAQGDPAAIGLIEASIATARKLGDLEVVGLGLNLLAGTAIQAGRLADAKQMAAEALTLLRRVGHPRNIVQALNVLGVAATIEGDEASAYAMYEDALAAAREIGMTETIARLVLNLGNLCVGRGDFQKARQYYEEAREVALKVGDAVGASAALTNLGVIAKAEGDYATARTTLIEALALKRDLGDGRGTAIALLGLAEVERFEGNLAAAQRLMAESLDICEQIEFSLGMIQGLETIAAIFAEAGEADVGLHVIAAADAARDSTGQKRSSDDAGEFDDVVARLREQVGEASSAAWSKGSSLSLPAAIRLARNVPAVGSRQG